MHDTLTRGPTPEREARLVWRVSADLAAAIEASDDAAAFYSADEIATAERRSEWPAVRALARRILEANREAIDANPYTPPPAPLYA